MKGFACNLTLSHFLGGPVKKTTLYNKANRVQAPPRGFEAFLLISTPTTQIKLLLKLGKGIHKDIFLDLQSVIGMA